MISSPRIERPRRSLLGRTISAVVLALAGLAPAGPTTAAPESVCKSVQTIYRAFLLDNRQAEAVDCLERLIQSGEISFGQRCLRDTVLHMLRIYFDAVKDTTRLEKLLYEVLSAENITIVESHFVGPPLSRAAERAVRAWRQPVALILSCDSPVVVAESSVRLWVEARNERQQLISIPRTDLTWECSPNSLGELSTDQQMFTAHQAGTVNIKVNVRSNPAVSSAKDITVKNSAVEMPRAFLNGLSPCRGVPGTVVTIRGNFFDPEPFANAVLFGPSAVMPDSVRGNLCYVRVPRGALSQTVRVVSSRGQATSQEVFTVFDMPPKPSVKWPVLATGLFAASATAWIVVERRVEYRPIYGSGGSWAPTRYERVVPSGRGVMMAATVASGITAGVLWIKYLKLKRAYREQMRKFSPTLSLSPDGSGCRVIASTMF